MVAHVRTNRVFSGRMYGRTRPNSCLVDVDRRLDFRLKLAYNDIGCDVSNQGSGKFTSDVVIQVLYPISFIKNKNNGSSSYCYNMKYIVLFSIMIQ